MENLKKSIFKASIIAMGILWLTVIVAILVPKVSYEPKPTELFSKESVEVITEDPLQWYFHFTDPEGDVIFEGYNLYTLKAVNNSICYITNNSQEDLLLYYKNTSNLIKSRQTFLLVIKK